MSTSFDQEVENNSQNSAREKWSRWANQITVVFFLVIVLLVIFLAVVLNAYHAVLFNPSPDPLWHPPRGTVEDLMITAPKNCARGNLHAWVMNRYKDREWILFLHGNNANITHRRYVVDMCDVLRVNMLLLDYRSFGRSVRSAPTLSSVCDDSEAAMEHLVNRLGVRSDRVIVWGESLGGQGASYVASRWAIKALVMHSTFSSVRDLLADVAYCGVATMADMAIRAFIPCPSSMELLEKVESPVAILHSQQDEKVNVRHAHLLLDSCSATKRKQLFLFGGLHAAPEIEADHFYDLIRFLEIRSVDGTPERSVAQRCATTMARNLLAMQTPVSNGKNTWQTTK